MSGQPAPDVAAIVTLLDHGGILKRLPRTGWLLNGVVPCESVADHTAGVALLTLALAGAINADWRGAGLAAPLDTGRAVTLAAAPRPGRERRHRPAQAQRGVARRRSQAPRRGRSHDRAAGEAPRRR